MGVNMIKPEDKFRSFCGSSFTIKTLDRIKKYNVQKYIWNKDYFYVNMYRTDSISKTTYYAELK